MLDSHMWPKCGAMLPVMVSVCRDSKGTGSTWLYVQCWLSLGSGQWLCYWKEHPVPRHLSPGIEHSRTSRMGISQTFKPFLLGSRLLLHRLTVILGVTIKRQAHLSLHTETWDNASTESQRLQEDAKSRQRGKKTHYAQRSDLYTTTDFSTARTKSRRQWNPNLSSAAEKYLPTSDSIPIQKSTENEDKVKIFSWKTETEISAIKGPLKATPYSIFLAEENEPRGKIGDVGGKEE